MVRILVTGATDGIGKQTAMDLASLGHHIILHGRDHSRLENTAREIKVNTHDDAIDLIQADFSSLDSVRKMAEELDKRYESLDVLINNAGIFSKKHEVSEDGIELTFHVNHLAPYLLTLQLLPLLKRGTAPARIVNVASMAHQGDVDLDNYNELSGYQAYSLSKAANIMFTYELADKLDPQKITVNTLHPGVISTKLLHAGFGGGGDDVEHGSETSVYLALSDEVKGKTGGYYVNSMPSQSSPETRDKEKRNELMRLSATLTGMGIDEV